jgi:hypothetical protein
LIDQAVDRQACALGVGKQEGAGNQLRCRKGRVVKVHWAFLNGWVGNERLGRCPVWVSITGI